MDNALCKTFDVPLASYKRKDDLKDVAAALALDQTGTIADLLKRCQMHLNNHPELKTNPRFAGLFKTRRTHVREIHNSARGDEPAVDSHGDGPSYGLLPSSAFPTPVLSGPSTHPVLSDPSTHSDTISSFHLPPYSHTYLPNNPSLTFLTK